MQVTLNLFRENIRRSRDFIALFRTLDVQTTGALDVSDILRSSLVMSVSALDLFIHEVVEIGMLEAYKGERVKTPAFLRFQVTLQSVLQASSEPDSVGWLEDQIKDRQGHQSFQMPESIADAVRHISEIALWNEVSRALGETRQDVTNRLTLIVQRRNKIAHEADTMPDYAGQIAYSDSRSPIDEVMVDDAVNFIERIAEAIYYLVSPDQTHRAEN